MLERNQIQIRLLTPLAKFLATESCDEITRAAIQVHGGIGFMAESAVGKLHLDGIVTTIYEGTSEIQVSFALKEIGKGALGIVFEELRKELGALASPVLAPFAARVVAGIERIEASAHALSVDFGYALLSARAVAEMVIAVIVATELLRQADHAPARIELAARWIHVRMLELEAHARRVIEGDAGRIERCEKIVRLWAASVAPRQALLDHARGDHRLQRHERQQVVHLLLRDARPGDEQHREAHGEELSRGSSRKKRVRQQSKASHGKRRPVGAVLRGKRGQ